MTQASALATAPTNDTNTKAKSKYIFDVLTKERTDGIRIVVSPKNPMADQQVYRVFALFEDQIKPHLRGEVFSKLMEVSEVTTNNNAFPKIAFETPPMRLNCKTKKMIGVGQAPTKSEDGGMTSWTLNYFFAAVTENFKERNATKFGGLAALNDAQLKTIALMKELTRIIERKRFVHPVILDPAKRKQILKKLDGFNPGAFTEEKAVQMECEQVVNDHDRCCIIGNQNDEMEGMLPGISLKHKCWYIPKQKPTPEENELQIEDYKKLAEEEKFGPQPEHINALAKGLRYRRVPVFAWDSRLMTYVVQPAPQNPNISLVRPGDYIAIGVELQLYHNAKGFGSTYHPTYFKVIQQSTGMQAQVLDCGADGYEELEDFKFHFKPKQEAVKEERGTLKRPRDDEMPALEAAAGKGDSDVPATMD